VEGNTIDRFQAISAHNIVKQDEWLRFITPSLREDILTVAEVLPFRTNKHVLSLIDWKNIPEDPMYQLTFPQREMLGPEEYIAAKSLLAKHEWKDLKELLVKRIRYSLNPHPAGQMTHNVPQLGDRPLEGLQHKYKETVLFFPAKGQTCHAYCTYCFRWAQFVGMEDVKFEAKEIDDLVEYLKIHKEVTDVLFTGGDPMIMSTANLRKCIYPLLIPELEHVQNIRIGTKAPAYWPQRFVSDKDADDCLRLFEEVVANGRHLAIMGHYTHPVELEPEIARRAARRIISTGAQIRMQAPLIRHVNDNDKVWADMWRTGVRLGMIPYYMFIERDTGAKNYFEVPLTQCYQIFRYAFSQVPGLARTVRGPSMSCFPGKVRIVGMKDINGERVFVLEMIQSRDPNQVYVPFFAKADDRATWFDQLEPASFETNKHFFVSERDDYLE
jgi:KamA family protein